MKKAIFKLILRKNRQNIDGTHSVYIYFKERGATRENVHTTHFKCALNDWSKKDQAFRASMKDSYPQNKLLNTLKSQCNAVIEKYYTDNKHLTFEKFLKELEYKDQPCNNVIEYIDTVIERKKGVIKPQSIRSYTQLKLKLEQMHPEGKLFFHEIDHNFLQRFDKYCREHDNNSNTVCRKHKTFQVIINHALRDELIKNDPYKFFKKGTIKGERNPINLFELKKLYEIYQAGTLTGPQQNALRMFLFMCMTGLRISDLLNLKYENIVTDIDESGSIIKLIQLQQVKTDHAVIIPLLPDAIELITNRPGITPEPDEYIFKEFRNGQNINYRMIAVAKAAEINKTLTNHVARHTFAALALSKGMGIYSVSKILGHTEVKTTEIYAHLGTQSKINEMQKLKGIFN